MPGDGHRVNVHCQPSRIDWPDGRGHSVPRANSMLIAEKIRKEIRHRA